MEETTNRTLVTGQQVIDEARKWIGVRYADQGRTREIGLDCGGLLIVVGRALGLTTLEELGYASFPKDGRFEALLDANCDRIDRLEIGSIIACDYGKGLQHTAFVSIIEPRLTVVHAKRASGVTEQIIHGHDLRGWERLGHLTYRLKGVEPVYV